MWIRQNQSDEMNVDLESHYKNLHYNNTNSERWSDC